MALGREIKVVLTCDDNGFSIKTRNAAESVKGLSTTVREGSSAIQRMEGAYNSIWGKMHRGITTIGMLRFALMDVNDILLKFPLSILKTSGEIQRMTVMMEGLSTASGDAAKKLEAASNVKFLFNMAQNAPFEVKALSDAFIKLKTGGIDPTNGSLQALTDGIARFGGGSQELHRASIAIQQMGGKGVVSMEELRQQLGEAVPTAMKAMASGMGMTMAKLAKAVEKGTVESSSAMSKMLVVMGMENAGAAAKLSNTWGGMLEKLKTKWELFKLRIGEEGMFDTAKKELENLLTLFDGGSSEDLGRRIGRWLNEALVNVIQLTKNIIQMWDYIVLAGKAWALFKTVNLITPVIAGVINGVRSMSAATTAAHTTRMQQMATERTAATSKAAAESIELRRWISENNQKITAEKARLQTVEAVGAQELASKVRNNQAIIQAHKERAAALMREETSLRNAALGLDMDAERIRRQKQAGSAAMARQVQNEAAATLASAEAVRRQREAYIAAGQALQTHNVKINQQIQGLQAAALAGSPVIASLNQQNNALAQAADKHATLATSMANSSRAATAMGTALRMAGGFLGSLLTPLNLVLVAVTVGAAAWEHYGNKAKEAARQAAVAAGAKEALERGKANEETLNAVVGQTGKNVNEISRLNKDIEFQEKSIALLKTRKGNEQRLAAAESELKRMFERRLEMQAEQGRLRGLGSQVQEQVSSRAAEQRGQDLVMRAEEQVAQSLRGFQERREKLENEFKQINKPSKVQTDQFLVANSAVHKQQADAAVQYWREKSRDFANLAKEAGETSEKGQSYARAAAAARKKETDALDQLRIITSPNEINAGKGPKTPKTPKGPSRAPTDDLLNELRGEQKDLLQARNTLENINSDVITIGALREQATREIDQIIEQDRRFKKVYTPADREQAIEAMTQRKLIDEVIKEQKALLPRVEQSRQDLQQMQERLDSGDFDKQPSNRQESKALKDLEKFIKLSPEAAAAYKQVADAQKEYLDNSIKLDVGNFIIDKERELRDQRIQLIEDPIQRQVAAAEQEIEIQRRKYETMRADAVKAGADVARLDATFKEFASNKIAQMSVGDEQELHKMRLSSIQDRLTRERMAAQEELDIARRSYEDKRAMMVRAKEDTSKLDAQHKERQRLMVGKFVNVDEERLANLRISTISNARERMRAEHQKEINDVRAKYTEYLLLAKDNSDAIIRIKEQENEELALLNRKQAEEAKRPLQQMVDQWKDTDAQIGHMQVNIAEGFVDMLTSSLGEGELKLGEWVKNVLLMVTNMQLKRALADPLNTIISGITDSIRGVSPSAAASAAPMTLSAANMDDFDRSLGISSDALDAMANEGVAQAAQATAQSAVTEAHAASGTQFFTSAMYEATAAVQFFSSQMGAKSSANFIGGALGAGVSAAAAGADSSFGYVDWSAAIANANGGIVDPALGKVPLRKYARGGIANRPQAAIYGEGDLPEAFVPLPDGRSIPVSMQGGGAPNVTINLINQSGTQVKAEQGQQRFDGKQMVLDVVLTAVSQPGPFRDGMKGAMRG